MTEYALAKTGEYPSDIPQFSKLRVLRKYLKDDKHNSFHLARKYAQTFVLGHYLFLKAHSFPRATLSENCSLQTDNARGQTSEHIFAPNGGCFSKIDDIKIKRNVSLFFPSTLLSSFSCSSLYFVFSLFGVILRPFGGVKSKYIWLFWSWHGFHKFSHIYLFLWIRSI